MSSKARSIYTDEIHNIHSFYANYTPGRPIKLGDYGLLEKNHFDFQGDLLKDFGNIKILERKDETEELFLHDSSGTISYNLTASGEFTSGGFDVANAAMDIKFSKAESVFVYAPNCLTNYIENRASLGKILIEIYKKNKFVWKRDFVVITEITHAKNPIVAIALEKDSRMVVEARTPDTPKNLIGKAGGEVGKVHQNKTIVNFINNKNVPLYFKLSRVRKKHFDFFGTLEFSSVKHDLRKSDDDIFEDVSSPSTFPT